MSTQIEPPKAAQNDPESTQAQNPNQGKGEQPAHLRDAVRGVTGERNAVLKNVGNTTSRALAIKAMCYHCLGCTADHYEPGVRGEIRGCTSIKCPLWHFRPFRGES